MLANLRDKVVLITGAASGIGRHFSLRFAQAGARVALADQHPPTATTQEIAATGKDSLAVLMDVTNESDVERGVAQVIEHYGTIDVLISNAGIQHISAFTDLSLEDWQKVLAVHLEGTFLTARAVFRHLVQQGKGGSILTMGSIHSHLASPLKAPYIAAKHGLAGLAKSLAVEGGSHGIRSYLICPGFVDTPLVRDQIPLQAARLQITEQEVVRNVMLRNTVDGQFTTVEELADVALFLAAFPTNALTGQAFIVSHGADMH